MICTVEGSMKKRAVALVKKIVEGYERKTLCNLLKLDVSNY